LHPADEVPGGLWEGATVHVNCAPGEFVHIRSGIVHGWHDTWFPPKAMSLILPGPLDLGLAGLAARVGRRHDGSTNTDPVFIAEALLEDRPDWMEGLWPKGMHDGALGWATQVLTTAASYFALTDRLCAAVGLELEPGEVARWGPLSPPGKWCLAVGRVTAVGFGHGAIYGVRQVDALADIAPDDHIAALRACVAALEQS
jgi:hypothetical protein